MPATLCADTTLRRVPSMPRFVLFPLTVLVLVVCGRVGAADETTVDWWALHGQTTVVTQYHPGFPSAFRGPNSLDPQTEAQETWDLTLFAGLRLWRRGGPS